jgi:hypothetical protein
VSVGMVMDVVSVAVGMRVNDFLSIMKVDRSRRQRAQKPRYIYQAQDNQHDCDGELHAESNPHWNDEIEQNDSRTDHKDGKGVANAPKCPDQSRPHPAPLITDDGCDRNDMVRVRSVAHPQKKSHREYGEKADHALSNAGADDRAGQN